MELYQLRSFVEISRIKNLTRAAENLHISQSALSSQIKALEEEFGLELFLRTPRGMEPTEQGRLLYSYAEQLLEGAACLLQKAREMSGRITGTCRVGLNTDGEFLQVSRLSRMLTSRFPEVNFIFVSSQTIRTAEMLRQSHIDLGFFFGEYYGTDIWYNQITEVTVRIGVPDVLHPPGQEPSWQELADLPWIWSVCDCPYYQIMQARFDEHGLVPRKYIDAMDEDVVKELVMDGQGVAMLRQDDADEVITKAPVHLLENISFTVPLNVAVLKNRASQPIVRAVLEVIGELWQ